MECIPFIQWPRDPTMTMPGKHADLDGARDQQPRQAGREINRSSFPVVRLFRRACPGALALIFVAQFAIAQAKDSSQKTVPLAVFARQPIREDQLSPPAKMQLQRMMEQVFAAKRRALQAVLDQKLLDAEAKRKGLSVEELIKSSVDAKVPEPTEAELRAYYDQNKTHINKPFEDAEADVRLQVKAAATNKAQLLYVQGLMERAIADGELSILLRPPTLGLPLDSARVKGNPKAPVTILEFSDFTCAACQRAASTIDRILAMHPDKVKLSFRDFAFTQIHPGALQSAEASRCAGEQGKFWEYYGLLFSNVTKQSHEDLLKDARSLELDDKQFEACLSSGRYDDQIEQDIQLGFRAGVVTAPAFFINGRFLEGAQPADAFERIIDQDLAGDQ